MTGSRYWMEWTTQSMSAAVWRVDTCFMLSPRWSHQSAPYWEGVWQLLIKRDRWRNSLKENMYYWTATKTEHNIFILLQFLLFFQPHLSPFSLTSTAASCFLQHRTKPFLLRAYQHICLEKLVFPSIFTLCFPKESLDPWTVLLVSFQVSRSKNPGCETKDPQLTTASH